MTDALRERIAAAVNNYCQHEDDGTDVCDCDKIAADVMVVLALAKSAGRQRSAVPVEPNQPCPSCGSLMVWQRGVEKCPYFHP